MLEVHTVAAQSYDSAYITCIDRYNTIGLQIRNNYHLHILICDRIMLDFS